MRREVLRLAAACLTLLVLAACGDDKVTNVGPAIDVVATHVTEDGRKLLDYGPVPVLDKVVLELLVRNGGLAPLTVRTAVIEGSDDAFRVKVPLGPDGLRIESGNEEVVEVEFQPPAQAEFDGTLTLEHDDQREQPVVVVLKGSGSTVGRVEIDPRSLDFGRVGERTQEVRTVTIRSVGTGPLIVESIVLAGAPEFSLLGSASTPARLPPPEDGMPGGAVDLLVACSPTEASPDEPLEGTLTIGTTDPENREIVVTLGATVNRAPVAVIGDVSGVPAPGDPVALDGSESHDVDGDDPVEYLWRIHRKPLGSEARIDDPAAATPNLLTDLPGTYVVGLDVADSTGLSCLHPDDNPAVPCETITIEVKPADDLYFELVWDHPDTDLDIHLLDDGAPLYSAKDCYYGNVAPDFGTFGDTTDDPRLTRDDLRGFGPERIVFSKPSDGGKFDVAVVFAKTNGALEPATTAILRVYVYGVLEAEMSTVLETRDQRWDVLSIEWPSAVITPIDTVQEP
ncbi:choice-of-anchor D domain-containing protein [Vulgatibacter sp.]|uniref:choice-of-anchor D domain-containing protein n=1 Tax=Vulgatibacter sp. TaxID=1971226 RepID=UPI003568599D